MQGTDVSQDTIHGKIRDAKEHLAELVAELTPTNLVPQGDRILLFPLPESFVRKVGSLYVASEDKRQSPRAALVLAVSKKAKEGIRVGDLVVTGSWTGQPCDFGHLDLRLVQEADLLGILDPSAVPEDQLVESLNELLEGLGL